MQRGANRGHEGRVVEPHEKAYEECEPRQMQDLDAGLETKKIQGAGRWLGHEGSNSSYVWGRLDDARAVG
jgi:hypothetical protein